MAVAGKVAITLSTENGGAWSADVTYDRLVAVKHNNNLYISRKTVTNVEPPNDEFWFLALEGFSGDDIEDIIDGTTQVGNAKTLDGHGAEYFFPSSGGEINGNVVVDKKATSAVETLIKVVNALGGIGLIISNSGNHGLWSNVHNKWLLKSELNGYTVVDAVATGNLPLNGGNFNEGASFGIRVNNAQNNETSMKIRNNDGSEVGGIGAYSNAGIVKRIFIGLPGDGSAYAEENSLSITKDNIKWKNKDILHTGNKPAGTYTGNGDATERIINTGGIGRAIAVIGSNGTSAIITNGAVAFGTSVTNVPKSEVGTPTSGATIYLKTTHEALNASGVEYTYQVL